MSADDIRLRVSEIQVRIAALSVRSVAAPATRAASAVSAGSGAQFAAALDAAVSATQPTGWTAPVNGPVTSEFGPRWGTMHKGIDLGVPTGTPVRAASGGTVRSASWNGGYGNAVIIDHDNGVSTLYAHNSALTVKPGQRVQAGEVIAKAGSTGDSTGPHLHFELRVNDKAIDPRPWLRERGVKL